ncbi:unnamed protein product, partial [Laminaria digitata]
GGPGGGGGLQVKDKNFKDTVLKSDGVWLGEFFAPWCGESYYFVRGW